MGAYLKLWGFYLEELASFFRFVFPSYFRTHFISKKLLTDN